MKTIFVGCLLLCRALFANEQGSDQSDPELYRMLFFLAKEEKNDAAVVDYLEKLVASGVELSDDEIYLYVREAIAIDEYELAQKVIDRVKKEMTESSVLLAAKEYLNQHREDI